MAAMMHFSQNRVFKSAGSISQTIFIQTTWNFAHFFTVRLSSKIPTGVLISLKLTDLWIICDLFFCGKYELQLQTYTNLSIFNIFKIWYVFY